MPKNSMGEFLAANPDFLDRELYLEIRSEFLSAKADLRDASPAEICAVFELNSDGDECYRRIEGEWLSPLPYVAIHKVASSFRHRGMLHRIVQFAKERSGHLKIDTHADNLVMQNALSKEGFSRRGIIHLADGSPRIAYEYFARTGGAQCEGKGGRDGTEGA